MSTLPLLYSTRSFVKPQKQGGIFSIAPQNRPNSKSLNSTSLQRSQSAEGAGQLTKNNISNYYTSRNNNKSKRSLSNTMGATRYAKSNFIQTKNGLSAAIMVTPDTINCRVGGEISQIDSIGIIYRNIKTSIILFNTVLSTDKNQLQSLSKSLKTLQSTTISNLQQLQTQILQKCKKLSKNLSQLRRQTHSQTKVNNNQMQKLNQDTINSKAIINNLQDKINYLCKQCNI